MVQGETVQMEGRERFQNAHRLKSERRRKDCKGMEQRESETLQ